jgi:hypothetical protein
MLGFLVRQTFTKTYKTPMTARAANSPPVALAMVVTFVQHGPGVEAGTSVALMADPAVAAAAARAVFLPLSSDPPFPTVLLL